MVSEIQVRLAKAGLTHSESRVAELVIKGMSNADIADKLELSEKTVKFHLTKIYKDLKLQSRAQLIVWALNNEEFA